MAAKKSILYTTRQTAWCPAGILATTSNKEWGYFYIVKSLLLCLTSFSSLECTVVKIYHFFFTVVIMAGTDIQTESAHTLINSQKSCQSCLHTLVTGRLSPTNKHNSDQSQPFFSTIIIMVSYAVHPFCVFLDSNNLCCITAIADKSV